MQNLLTHIVKRAEECRCACVLQVVSAISFLLALHTAASHQGKVSPVLFILWLVGTGMLVTLSLAINRDCAVNQILRRRSTSARLQAA